MSVFSYLSSAEEMCDNQRLEDAELQRLVEEVWRARVATHQSVIETRHPLNQEGFLSGYSDLCVDGDNLNEAYARLGGRYLAYLGGNPLGGLHPDKQKWFVGEVGEALLRVVFDKGVRRIEACEQMWSDRNWEGLLHGGFIDDRHYKAIKEDRLDILDAE